MDKRTLLAIVLSVAVVLGFSTLNGVLFPAKARETVTTTTTELQQTPTTPSQTDPAVITAQPLAGTVMGVIGEDPGVRSVVLRNEKAEASFTNKDGLMEAFTLLSHSDGEAPLEMVNRDFGGAGSFEMTWGGPEATAVRATFEIRQPDEKTVEFYRDFTDLAGNPFTLTKRFTLLPDEYMVQLEILLQGKNNIVPVLPGNEKGWSVEIGPQLGPKFVTLDGQKEFRKYWSFANDNMEEITLSNELKSRTQPLIWAGIAGKYFALLAIPNTPGLETSWSNKQSETVKNVSKIIFTSGRPVTVTSSSVIKVYLGPKQYKELGRYDQIHLDRIIDRNMFLGWLEDIMKAGLNLFYMLIPNYGVGIIILTILLRLVMTPLTISGQRSTAAMQTLQPKIKDLQAKYKNDPGKLNEAMALLYQKEKINPLGGCLPMLLQLPLFFAFYGLLSSHFELRGAMFIPGWINDLSLPDTLFSFNGFRLPILNWSAFRLLPIIMLGSQLLMSKFTPTPATSGIQAKIFTLGLPILFFFWLYEFPSGLILYWTVTNILSAVQQYYINTHLKKKPAK